VYIDVHKAIRRLAPAPKARVQRRPSEDHVTKPSIESAIIVEQETETQAPLQNRKTDLPASRNDLTAVISTSPKTATFMMRRSSTGLGGGVGKTAVPVRANIAEMREHLKHLGPSNPAINPKNTKSTTVKIKPGPRAPLTTGDASMEMSHDVDENVDETTSLLKPQPDAVQALRNTSYGSGNADEPRRQTAVRDDARLSSELLRLQNQADEGVQTSAGGSQTDLMASADGANRNGEESLRGYRAELQQTFQKRSYVRSGSITENIFETRGVRKVVLETSSNDEDDSSTAVTWSPETQKSRGLQTADEDSEESGLSDKPVAEVSGGPHAARSGSAAAGAAQGGGGEGTLVIGKKKQRKKKRNRGRS
jgi:metal transporter CNNM